MAEFTFRTLAGDDGRLDLRLFGPDGKLMGTRSLTAAEVKDFAFAIARDYALLPAIQSLPAELALGRRLFAWLDGPNEHWMEKVLQPTGPLVLRFEVTEEVVSKPLG